MDFSVEKEKWLNSKVVPQFLKNELNSLSNKDLEYAFLNKLEFGTAGIRSKMGPGPGMINVVTIRQISYSFAKYIKSKKVKNPSIVIVHDNRFNSDVFALEAAKVFASFQIKVYIPRKNELRATPYASYLIPKLKATAGLVVTASHNPKEDNGYKIYDEFGCQLLPSETKKIQNSMREIKDILEFVPTFDNKNILEIDSNMENEYLHDVSKVALHPELNKKIKIVYTPLHGAGSTLTTKLYEMNGYDFHPVKKQFVNDPNFGDTKSSNPEEEIAFEKAIELANQKKINLIIAADPDADRMAFAEKHQQKWKIFSGNEMGILFLNYLLSEKKHNRKSLVVSTHISTSLIDKIAKGYDNICISRVATGFKFIGNEIRKHSKKEFILGFEEAVGSALSAITRDKDSYQAGLFVADMANFYAHQNKALVEVLLDLKIKHNNWLGKTISILFEKTVDWKERAQAKIDLLAKKPLIKLGEGKLTNVSWNDDDKAIQWFYENDSWIKFRLSGTEPKLKIYFEIYNNVSLANSAKIMKKGLEKIKQIIA